MVVSIFKCILRLDHIYHKCSSVVSLANTDGFFWGGGGGGACHPVHYRHRGDRDGSSRDRRSE